MQYVCAWCRCSLYETPTEEGLGVSHGICSGCAVQMLAEAALVPAADQVLHPPGTAPHWGQGLLHRDLI